VDCTSDTKYRRDLMSNYLRRTSLFVLYARRLVSYRSAYNLSCRRDPLIRAAVVKVPFALATQLSAEAAYPVRWRLLPDLANRCKLSVL